MRGWEEYRYRAQRTGAPATVALVVLLVLSFLVAWTFRGTLFLALGPDAPIRPWSFLTFPFADSGDGRQLFWFLILLFWMWWVSSAMEMDVGAPKLIGFWVLMTALFGISIWVGMVIMNVQTVVFGPGLPVSALTVAWGTRHQNDVIRLWMVIPIQGKWLAILSVLLVFFSYGTGAPLMGAFAVAPLILSYLYAANRLVVPYGRTYRPTKPTKASERHDQKYFDEVRKREQERAERERLRKLFEGSIRDEDER
jgi:signal transduction histidine kinase